MVQPGTELKLDFFPGAKAPSTGLAILKSLELVPRSAITAALPRAEDMQPMGQIRRITVHHTGFPDPWLADDVNATGYHLVDILTLHTDPAGRNWADFGYHYAVDRMGRIWQLRDLRFQGAHVKNHNTHNAGIVVLGNFDLQQPPGTQVTALAALLNFMLSAYDNLQIHTHQQLADQPTSCPGRHLQTWIDQTFGGTAAKGYS